MNKYRSDILKYIVEILVIIFGILGAFALDRWNEKRNNKKLEKEVLTQISEDLTFTLEDLKNDFIVHEIALKSHFTLDSVIKNKVKYSDNMAFDFYWIKEDEYIFPNQIGYRNLESIGTSLISNQELRTSISYIFNHDFPRITKGNNLFPDINEFLTPYYQENFKANQKSDLKYTLSLENDYKIVYPREVNLKDHKDYQYIGFIPKDYNRTINDPKFNYLLSEAKKFRIYKYKKYKSSIANVEGVLVEIKKYLVAH
ncbi:MAG: hypothetical protein RLZZ546_2312 [Bacteroidota bacterium]|jgi:hypothetical protein